MPLQERPLWGAWPTEKHCEVWDTRGWEKGEMSKTGWTDQNNLYII